MAAYVSHDESSSRFSLVKIQFGTAYLAIILAKKTPVATSGHEEAKLYRRKKANYDIQVYRGINV